MDCIHVAQYLRSASLTVVDQLSSQLHELEHYTFVSFAALSGTSLIISADIIQSLVGIFDFIILDKSGYTTESILGFETYFARIPATVARMGRGGMASRHGI